MELYSVEQNINAMKRKLFYFTSALALIIISCGDRNSENEVIKKIKPNENVISFKIENILNSEYQKKRPDSLFSIGLDPKTDTIKYSNDEIYISYLSSLTGCVEYAGDIEIKKDSLLLKLIQVNNMACTELNIGRIVFRIKNPKNIKYKFGKYKK